jgi:hypothetical protein
MIKLELGDDQISFFLRIIFVLVQKLWMCRWLEYYSTYGSLHYNSSTTVLRTVQIREGYHVTTIPRQY